jgi:hypothetical protein
MRLEVTAVRPEMRTLCISGRRQGIEACTPKLMIAVHVGDGVSQAVENLLVRRECTLKKLIVEASRSCYPVFASGRTQSHGWLHHFSVALDRIEP